MVHNCYRETLEPHGWLLAAEVARKRTETTAEMWRTEIELQEPSAEGRSIDVDAVERMFRRDLGETEGLTGRTEEFEGPVPGGEYATAADWARKRDLTTIATLRHDVAPMRFVSLYRDKGAAWHVVAKRFNDRVARYGGVAIHDANGVGDNMREHLDAPDIEDYMGWQGRQRVALFSDYIAAIEAGDVVCPLSEPWYRAHRYLSNDALYGSGHPPDEFIACALAYRAARPVADEEPVRYAGAWGGARSRRPAAVEGQVATGGSWGGGRSRRR